VNRDGLYTGMKLFAQLVSIAGVHIAFLFSAYGTSFFGLNLNYYVVIVLWLVVPSLVVLAVYYRVLSNSHWKIFTSYKVISLGVCATTATSLSLLIGIFLAFNYFGT